MDIREANAAKINDILAGELKKMPEFEMPEWALLVKTGTHSARPPFNIDFWHRRGASILRQLTIKGVVGVSRLRTKYGGRKDRGMAPPEFRKSGGKIIRTLLQQAEKAGLVEKAKGKKAGRQLTKKGLAFINEIAEKVK